MSTMLEQFCLSSSIITPILLMTIPIMIWISRLVLFCQFVKVNMVLKLHSYSRKAKTFTQLMKDAMTSHLTPNGIWKLLLECLTSFIWEKTCTIVLFKSMLKIMHEQDSIFISIKTAINTFMMLFMLDLQEKLHFKER